jgi:hypothetical protein
MRTKLDEHRALLKSRVALASRGFGRAMFALLFSLFSCTWLAFSGGTGHAQSLAAQSAAMQTEINVLSLDATGRKTRLAGVTAKSGILVFDTLATYERSYPVIFNMSAEQSEAWEKSLGFVSQRNIFNQIVKAEYAYLAAPYEGKGVDELRRMTQPRGHTAVYEKYLRSGVIRTERDKSGDETYTCAIPIGGYLPIINEQGYFIVGDTVYQIKNKLIKEMSGGELSNLAALDRATSDDPVARISVHRVVENSPATSATGAKAASNCSYPLSSGWLTNGNRRGSITVNFSKTYVYPYPYTKVIINYNVNVKSQKKTGGGNWVYPSCPNECWLSFNWTGVFDYMSKVTLGYAGSTVSPRSFSYPHPNCINDFNGSFSPITGTNAPYPSSFTFTAPSGLAFLDVGFQNSFWHASVPGGSSGIPCNVGCP